MCHLDLIGWLFLLNIGLSALHALLEWMAPRTRGIWDDRLLKLIEWLRWALEQVMAARTGRKK